MKRLILPLLTLLLAALACNLPAPTPVPTQVQVIVVTSTNLPPSPLPSVPVLPSPTSLPTRIPTVLPSPTFVPCNQADFVKDVTYPDNTQVTINTAFTKTWRLKNIGTCTWTSGYSLVFDSGDMMGGPTSQPLTTGSVAPGQTVDISVDLVAPATTGTFRGNWRIREPGGTLFGLGTGPFWVQIQTVAPVVTLPDWPTLSQGSSGDEVYALQYLLRYYGSTINADGIFGPQTRTAVISFQATAGLSQDGIVGKSTWTALTNGLTLSVSSSNEAVRAVQFLLSSKYGYSVPVDGTYSANVKLSVADFQSNYNLTSDGIVGPITWQALLGY